MTLVEMLVAMAITLIMVYGMVLAFGQVGKEASDGRAKIEMANQMRNVMRRLETDVNGLTVPVRNWNPSGAAAGYFELIEGPGDDNTGTVFGDTDDILMFTTRNEGEPFLGRLFGNTISSTVAEVVWSVQAVGTAAADFSLHRRARLVRPDLNNASGFIATFTGTVADLENRARNFLLDNDLSVRFSLKAESGGGLRLTIIANSLDSLAIRENRFAHRAITYSTSSGPAPLVDERINQAFPHLIYTNFFNTLYTTGNRLGESVMMSHSIAFDVKAYDPLAPLHFDQPSGVTPAATVGPADPGYTTAISNPVAGRGAFVDLAFNPALTGNAQTYFSGWPHARSGLSSFRVYDTWTSFYETNGLNDDASGSDSQIDEGSDGADTDNANGVDDLGERETRAPYERPLRGLEITLRMYETDTRQVRQQSLITDFLPE